MNKIARMASEQYLVDILLALPVEQRTLFRKMYSNRVPDRPITKIVSSLSDEKINTAVGQVLATLAKNTKMQATPKSADYRDIVVGDCVWIEFVDYDINDESFVWYTNGIVLSVSDTEIKVETESNVVRDAPHHIWYQHPGSGEEATAPSTENNTEEEGERQQ